MDALWVVLAVLVVVAIVAAGHVVLGAFDPEGRGSPHEGLAIVVCGASLLLASGIVGALLHRHFTGG